MTRAVINIGTRRSLAPWSAGLLAKLREPDNTWFFDPRWETCMPPAFAPALKILAAERPESHWGQLAKLLAPEEE